MSSQALKAVDVFTPGAFPTHTYIQREGPNFERLLANGLEVPGNIVSIAGPSKSGKTVLVERVVGSKLVEVGGAGVKEAADLWDRILNALGEPHEASAARTDKGETGGELEVKAGTNLLVVEAEAALKVAHAKTKKDETAIVAKRRGVQQVMELMRGSEDVLLIDDFHYIAEPAQVEIAEALKEAVHRRVRVCIATVPHRSDDVIRACSDLRGRVRTLDLSYWPQADLERIATQGFQVLNATLDPVSINEFAIEAAGSPQLMQLICLEACFNNDLRQPAEQPRAIKLRAQDRREIYEQTTASIDYSSLANTLARGPRIRGTERTIYPFKTGGGGDVYSCILHAVAVDPPQLSFSYEVLVRRVKDLCLGATPPGSSLTGTCGQMVKLALDKQPRDRALDWNPRDQILDIPDPYLLFYLRWSTFLPKLRAVEGVNVRQGNLDFGEPAEALIVEK